MNKWTEWVVLVILVGFMIFEVKGDYIGSATHTIVVPRHV
jgi:hypothetical protein